MSEWKPINTAPKDQVILAIIAYNDGEIHPDPITIIWHEHTKKWSMSHCSITLNFSDDNEDSTNPIAWMPVPKVDILEAQKFLTQIAQKEEAANA
jgi:hypothetical protein